MRTKGANKKVKNRARRVHDFLDHSSDFSVVEAYKTIRTNLMFAIPKAGCKKIIVTSSVPKEGKSTSVTNLAISLAQANARVLLIDCDMRKPFVHKIFKMKAIPGLSDVLGGLCGLADAIQATQYPSLMVICAGTIPPNPGELLGSAVMADMIAFLDSKFDYILLDTPPVNLVSDTLSLTKIADGVVMVARQDVTLHPEFAKALNSLEFAGAKVAGVIMNDVESGRGYGYKKYRYDKKYQGYYNFYKEPEKGGEALSTKE